jgi:hypothetical protein
MDRRQLLQSAAATGVGAALPLAPLWAVSSTPFGGTNQR